METFKTINKVPHLEELNELIIELYEFKRARIKARRLRHSLSKLKKETEERERNASSSRLVKSVNKYGMNATVLGLTAVGVGVVVVIGKIFG
jgi:ribosome-interacting GTPase 1